jgi:hypothetical protein
MQRQLQNFYFLLSETIAGSSLEFYISAEFKPPFFVHLQNLDLLPFFLKEGDIDVSQEKEIRKK